MKRLLFLALLGGMAGLTCAEPASTNDFTGHYELAKNGPKFFALDVSQKGKTAEVSFSAAHENGSGAAPDGEGKGRLNGEGALQFDFKDSFENTGTAVLRRDGKRFLLAMKMSRVTEARAVIHYGHLTLKRTSTKPQTNER